MTKRRLSYKWQVSLWMMALSFLLVGCVGNLGTSWPSLTVLENGRHVIFAHENTLKIVDVVTGEPVALLADGEPIIDENGESQEWIINGGDYDNAQFFGAPLQVGNDELLVPVADGRLIRVEVPTARVVGSSVTVQARGNLTTDLSQAGNNVLIGLQDELLAVNSESLEQAWAVPTDHAVWAEPLEVNGMLYFVSLDHFMYAIDAESGEEAWRLDLGGAGTSTPAYDEEFERLYIGTFNSEVLSVSLAGEVINRFETDGWVWARPVIVQEEDGAKVYVSDLSGYVYKLNPDLTLSEDWPAPARPTEAAIRVPPLVFEEYVVVGSRDQGLYYIDREDGNVAENLTRQLDGEILTDILYFSADELEGLAEDLLVVSTLSDREALVGFNANTGERIWTIRRR